MFNLFTAKHSGDVQIAKSAKQLLAIMKASISERQPIIDAQGDEHHEIDLRLVSKINRALDPLIGPSEGKDAVWFQSMDWHGDGIRHLEFHLGKFPSSAILRLQYLLKDEYSPFGILCWAPVEPNVPPENEQGIVIFSNAIAVTAKLASQLGMPN